MRSRKTEELGPCKVIPPGHHSQLAGHHWLETFDGDGRSGPLFVLQWQPGVQQWCTSGMIATGMSLELDSYIRYVAPCPQPLFEDERKQLREAFASMDKQFKFGWEDSDKTPHIPTDTWALIKRVVSDFIY